MSTAPSLLILLVLISSAMVLVVSGAPRGGNRNHNHHHQQQQVQPAETNRRSGKQQQADPSSAIENDFNSADDSRELGEAGEASDDKEFAISAADAAEPMDLNERADADEDAESPAQQVGQSSDASAIATKMRWNDNESQLDSLDTNIANAKVRLSSADMATAAGHHHGKKHYVSGWLKMGAETGKKGAFKWHDKHPVGGKGRR